MTSSNRFSPYNDVWDFLANCTRRAWYVYIDNDVAPGIMKAGPSKGLKIVDKSLGFYMALDSYQFTLKRDHSSNLYTPVTPDGVEGAVCKGLREAKILAEKMVWAYIRRQQKKRSKNGQVESQGFSAAWIAKGEGSWF